MCNVIIVIDVEGWIVGGYVKVYFVFYGEYLLLCWLLELFGVLWLVVGEVDFWLGLGLCIVDLGVWGKVGM